jgi:hypothetical protein
MIEHEIIEAQLHHCTDLYSMYSDTGDARTWLPRLPQVKDSVVARMVLGVRNTILQHMRQKARLPTQNFRVVAHGCALVTEVTETLTSLWGTPIDFRIWVRHHPYAQVSLDVTCRQNWKCQSAMSFRKAFEATFE